MAKPRAPAGLGGDGKALWKAILDDLSPQWELDARELDFLERACRCADELRELEKAIDKDGITVEGSRGQTIAHPALSEARQLRLVQMRLLGSIELTDPKEGIRSATPAQARGRHAAKVRWDLEEARSG
jgi:P27 family predicted phage terminase small subunit